MIEARGNYVYEVESFENGTHVEQFVDYVRHVVLSVDEYEIASDGLDQAVLTVHVFDYDGELQTMPLIVPVDIEGTTTNVITSAGAGVLVITSDQSGPIRIQSVDDSMRNGEVELYAY